MPHKKDQNLDKNPKRNWVYKIKKIVCNRCDGKQKPDGSIDCSECRGLGYLANPRAIDEQIRLSKAYANRLIEIERNWRQEQDDALESRYPGYIALKNEYGAAWHALERAKKGGTSEDRKAADARCEAAGKAFRPVRKEVWGRSEVKDAMKAIDENTNEARKRARGACGLYSGTYQLVEASVKASVSELNKVGQAPGFRTWVFDGAVGVQIVNGISWRQAFACTDTKLRFEVIPLDARPTHTVRGKALKMPDPNSKESQRRKLVRVWFRVDSDDDGRPVWFKLVTYIKREPPADTMIKTAQLIRSQIGRRVMWKLVLALSRPEWTRPRGQSGTAHVSIPAKPHMASGALHVARAEGSDGRPWDMDIPLAELDRWHQVARLQSVRDAIFNDVREKLVAWLVGRKVEVLAEDSTDDVPGVLGAADAPGVLDMTSDSGALSIPDWLLGRIYDRHGEPVINRRTGLPLYKQSNDIRYVRRWREPDALVRLAQYWAAHRFPADRMIYPAIDVWMNGEMIERPDKDGQLRLRKHGGELHLHEYQDGCSKRAARWRDEQLRRWAAILAAEYKDLDMTAVNYATARLSRKGVGRSEQREETFHANVGSPGRLARFVYEAFGVEPPRKGNGRRLAGVASGEVVDGLPGIARETEGE